MARKIEEIKMDALKTALNALGNEFEAINIFTIAGDSMEDRKEGKALQFGVNWGAMGTQSIEETKKFAKNLIKATEICEVLNSLELSSRTLNDRKDYNSDQYHNEVKKAKYLIELGAVDLIDEWFVAEVH